MTEGAPNPFGIRAKMLRLLPSSFDISMTPRSESVQYRLRPYQSTAICSGALKQQQTTHSTPSESVELIDLR